MPRFINIQDNFSSGELGPFIKSRLNLDIYKNGVDQMLNWMPTKFGATSRRPGSTYIGEITHLTGLYDSPAIAAQTVQDVHLIPFQNNSSDGYIIAIVKLQTRTVIQFYTYTGQYFSPLVSTYSTDWEIPSSWISSLGTLIPTDLDIHKFQYVQYGNVLVLTHESNNIAPIVVSIINPGISGNVAVAVNYMYDFVYGNTYAAVSNNLAEQLSFTPYYPNNNIAPFLKIPFTSINSTQTTIAANEIVPTTSYTLTASSPIFKQGMIGSLVKLTIGAVTTTYKITGFTSTSVVNATRVGYAYGSYAPTATKLWEIQAWNSFWGHPSCVSVIEQRMVMAATKKFPDSLWFSATGNIFLWMQKRLAQDLTADTSGLNFYGSVSVNDPFDLVIASESTSNKIQWLSSSKSLYAGSLGADYVIYGGNGALAYNNFQIRSETEVGSEYVKPVKIDNTIVYVGKDGHELRQFQYSENNGSHISKDLTLLFGGWEFDYSPYPSNLKINQLAFNKSRSSIFALFRNVDTSRSNLRHIVLDAVSGVQGASTYSVGGDAEILSTICLPNTDTRKENVIMLVKRNYSGNKFVIEELHDDFDKTTLTNYENATDISVQTAYAPSYMDCCKIYAGVSTSSFTHPILKSASGLSALIDGKLYEGLSSDASGNITLPVSGNVVLVGIPFTSRLKLLKPNLGGFGNNDGIMSRKRIDKVFIEYRNTKHLLVGTSLTNLLSFEIDTDYANNVDLYSGNKSKAVQNSSEENGQVIISTDKPYPATILQVGYRGVTEEI